MLLHNFRHITAATIFLLFPQLVIYQVTGATLERRLGSGQVTAQCAPTGTLVTPQHCDVAVLTLPFTNKRSILNTQTTVTSVFKSCKVIVACEKKTQTTSMALISNNRQNGGYTRLINECGRNARPGTIFFDSTCSVRITNA